LAALFYAILQHRNWSGAIFRKENLRPSLFWNLYLAFLTVPTTLVGTTKLSPTFINTGPASRAGGRRRWDTIFDLDLDGTALVVSGSRLDGHD
jgi:hypothetical protein